MEQQNGKLPDVGKNPVQVALENYNDMADRLAASENECTQLRDMNKALVVENQITRSNYQELRRNFDRVQAYSTNLTTRLAVIQEVIAKAISESAKFAIRPAASADQPTPQDLDEQKSAEEMANKIAAIPGNEVLPKESMTSVLPPKNQL